MKLATRSNVRQLVASEITSLQSKVHKLEEENKHGDPPSTKTEEARSELEEKKSDATHLYTQKIQSYGNY